MSDPARRGGERAMLAGAGFYALCSVTMHVTKGLFDATWLPVYFAGFVAWIALAYWRADDSARAPREVDLALLALCALAAWWWTDHALLADSHRGPARTSFRALPWAVVALCGAAAVMRRAAWPIAVSVALLIYAKTFIIECSPVPFIDVFTSNTRAADLYLQGLNPYTQTYPDIYGGNQDYRAGMVYWPAVLVWQSWARAAFGDIRWGFVLAEAITVGALTAALVRAGLTLRRAALACLLLLLSPVAPFVFEQAWVDPLLTAAFALFACAMAFEQAVLAGCALGLAVALKQYGALGALVGVALIARSFDRRRAAQSVIAAAATFAVTTLPIALQQLDAFVEMTVRVPGRMGLRRDALSLLAFFGGTLTGPLPNTVTLAAAVLSTGLGALWVYRAPRPTLTHWAAATGLAYGGLFFFGKQAFCNYHHFLGGFALIHAAALWAETSRRDPETAHRGEADPGGVATEQQAPRRRARRGRR